MRPVKLCALVTGFALMFATVSGAQAMDIDLDGIDDAADNCLLAPNPQQIDSDADGWGNTCDADFDNNGVVNIVDLAIMRENFFTADADTDINGDGVVNAIDLGLIRLLFFEPPGPAGYAQWVNPVGGDWFDAGNWFPAAVPPSGSNVLIGAPGLYTVRFGGESSSPLASVAGIESLRGFEMISGRLNVTGDISGTADIELSGGTLVVSGDLSANTLTIAAGALENATVNVNQPVLIAARDAFVRAVTFASDVVIGNAAHLNVRDGLTLDDADITLNSDGNASFLLFHGEQALAGHGRIVFAGTVPFDNSNRVWQTEAGANLTIGEGIEITATSAGGRIGNENVDGQLTLRGSIKFAVGGRDIAIDGPFENYGAIEVSNGATLILRGEWSNFGLIDVNGGAFDIERGANAQWANAGDIMLANTSATFGGAFTTADIESIVTNAPLVITGELDNTGSTLNTDDLSGGLVFVSESVLRGGLITGEVPLIFALESPVSSTVPARLESVTLAVDAVIQTRVEVVGGLVLDDATVELTRVSFPETGSLIFIGTQTLGGAGTIAFTRDPDLSSGGARLSISGEQATLTIDEGITLHVRRGSAQLAGGQGSVVMDGPLIVDSYLLVIPARFTLNSTVDVAAGARVEVRTPLDPLPADAFLIGASGVINLDVGPDGQGAFEFEDAVTLDGALNVTLVDGLVPEPCERFELFTYPVGGRVGSFAQITSAPTVLNVRELSDTFEMVADGTGCNFELNRLLGTTFAATSREDQVMEVSDNDFSSWCSEVGDLMPVIEVDWPGGYLVSQVDVRTTSNSWLDAAGIRLFDTTDALVFDGPLVDLASNQTVTIPVPDNLGAIGRAELQGMETGIGCVRELDILGREL